MFEIVLENIYNTNPNYETTSTEDSSVFYVMKTFTGFNYDFKMKNVTFENVHNTGRMFILEIWNLGSKYSRYSMTDIYFKNVNSDKGMFRFYGGQQVEIGGIHIDNITLLTDTHALQIENVSSLQLHNITIKNVTPPNLYTNSVFHLVSQDTFYSFF